MADSNCLRLGTRGSPLARWQAEWVKHRLEEFGAQVRLVLIQTTGDVKSGPIGKLAIQGVFTKEIQRALLSDQIDLAVHSLKDLPTEPVPGLQLAAVPVRAAVGDALLTHQAASFDELPAGARVATGSHRRRAQLLAARPDLVLVDVRGNIETRLEKLRLGDFDALVLAQAGLHRLQLDAEIVQVFEPEVMLPAVGQGALGLEIRADDDETRQWVARLDDPPSHQAVRAERALLARLRGGCLAPVGAWGRVTHDAMTLDGAVLSVDGRVRVRVQVQGRADSAAALGQEAADQLLGQGAGELIAASRRPDLLRDD